MGKHQLTNIGRGIVALATGVAILGGSALFVGQATDYRSVLIAEQDNLQKTDGKFRHVPKFACRDYIQCQIDEHLYPDGTRGYTLREWRTNQDGTVDYRESLNGKMSAWEHFADPSVNIASTTPL